MEKLIASVPRELAEEARWVVTPLPPLPNSKVPHGAGLAPKDVQTLSGHMTFETALENCPEGWTVGLVLGDGVMALDLDNIKDADGTVKQWALDILETVKTDGALRIFSSSGNGLHIIGRVPIGAEVVWGREPKRIIQVAKHDDQKNEQIEVMFRGYIALNPNGLMWGELASLQHTLDHAAALLPPESSEDPDLPDDIESQIQAISGPTTLAQTPDSLSRLRDILAPYAMGVASEEVLGGTVLDGSEADLIIAGAAARAGFDPQKAWDAVASWRMAHYKKKPPAFNKQKLCRRDYIVGTLTKAYSDPSLEPDPILGNTAPALPQTDVPSLKEFPFIMINAAEKTLFWSARVDDAGNLVGTFNDGMKKETFNQLAPVQALAGRLGLKGGLGRHFEMYFPERVFSARVYLPGLPPIVEGYSLTDDGQALCEDPRGRIFNTFSGVLDPKGGVAARADQIWAGLVRRLYGDEAEHILDYFAFKYQNPGTKINHAIILGGKQGIGKDSILAPLVRAYGTSGYTAVSIDDAMNSFRERQMGECILLQLPEASTGGATKTGRKFATWLKKEIAGSATAVSLSYETLCSTPLQRCNEKFGWGYAPNVKGVVIDTNASVDAIYIEPGDRRYFFVYSREPAQALLQGKLKEERAAFFKKFYDWLGSVGAKDVAAFLALRDVSHFDPAMAAPDTAIKKFVMEQQMSESELALKYLFDNYAPKVLVRDVFQEWCIGRGWYLSAPDLQMAMNSLGERGYTVDRERRTVFKVMINETYVLDGQNVDELKEVSFDEYLDSVARE